MRYRNPLPEEQIARFIDAAQTLPPIVRATCRCGVKVWKYPEAGVAAQVTSRGADLVAYLQSIQELQVTRRSVVAAYDVRELLETLSR